jgi:hypothetical protein
MKYNDYGAHTREMKNVCAVLLGQSEGKWKGSMNGMIILRRILQK